MNSVRRLRRLIRARAPLPRGVQVQGRQEGQEFGDGSRDGSGEGLPQDLVLELVAGLLDAGLPPRGAVELVADSAGLDRSVRSVRSLDALAELVELSESTGLPLAALVRARADDLRREREVAHGRAVRRLAVLLVLPMGLCLLPAFVLLAVVPLVLDLLVRAP